MKRIASRSPWRDLHTTVIAMDEAVASMLAKLAELAQPPPATLQAIAVRSDRRAVRR